MKEQSRSGLHTTIMCAPNLGNQLADSPNHSQLTTSADILLEQLLLKAQLSLQAADPPTSQPMCFGRSINVCWQFQIEVTCCHGAKYPFYPFWMPGREGSFVRVASMSFYIATNIQIWMKGRFRGPPQLFNGSFHLLPPTLIRGLKTSPPLNLTEWAQALGLHEVSSHRQLNRNMDVDRPTLPEMEILKE